MTVLLVTKAWGALSRLTGLEIFRTAYWSYLLYDGKRALLHVLISRSVGFPPQSQREALSGLELPLTTEEKATSAAWESSRAVDHAMRLMTSHLLCNMHALFGNSSLYTLDGDKLPE